MRCVEVICFDIGDKDELTVHQRATRGRGWIPNLHRWKDYSGSRLISTVRRQVGNFDGFVQQDNGAELGRHRAAGGVEDVLQVRKVPIHLGNILAGPRLSRGCNTTPLSAKSGSAKCFPTLC